MSRPTTTRIAEDTTRRLSELVKSLKGWNLIVGLYEEKQNVQDDLVHAYANEARELVLMSLRLTFELGVAAMKERHERFDNLLQRLDSLDEREKTLSALCRKALLGKEVA